MTHIEKVILLAHRLEGQYDYNLRRAASVIESLDEMQRFVEEGAEYLAVAHADRILENMPENEKVNEAIQQYENDSDILGLLSRLKAAVYGA